MRIEIRPINFIITPVVQIALDGAEHGVNTSSGLVGNPRSYSCPVWLRGMENFHSKVQAHAKVLKNIPPLDGGGWELGRG